MLIMPVSYCFSASVMHTHLYQGGGVVFDSRFMFPDQVLRSINTYRCTTFAGVPTVYNILLRRSNLRSIPLPGLRRFLQAGGALAPQSVLEMREIVPTAEFFVMYGQTEATARMAYLPFGTGARVCVGAQFAMTEAVLVLAHLVKAFEITLVDSVPVLPAAVVTTQPDRMALFRFRRRGA